MEKKFNDIVDYEYKGSSKRKRMPVNIRAKIFMPFSVLNGFDQIIKNTRYDVEKSFDNNFDSE